MDKLDLVVDIVKGIAVKQGETSKDISEMKVDVALNKEDLKVHMAQTVENRKFTVIVEEKLSKRLEHIEDRLTLKYLGKLIMAGIIGSGTIAGSIYGVIKLINYLSK